MPSTPLSHLVSSLHTPDPSPDPTYAFPRVIDNTMYERWKSCPHQFFRADVQGLRLAEPGAPGEPPRLRKSIHLHFGAVFAAGLEATRREWTLSQHEDLALSAGADTILASWQAEQEDLPPPRTRTEEAKTLDNCLLAHAGYFREWPLDDDRQQLYHYQGKPCIELSGAREIPGTHHPETGEPILYAGRFDAVVNRGGQAWGLDDKTTGASVEADSWSRQWRLRGQFTGYCWLAARWDLQVEWFLIHGVQVLKTKCNYAEATEVRPRWMIDRWLAQLQADVRTMCEQWRAFQASGSQGGSSQPHPYGQAFGHACFDYQSPCQFQTLCGEPLPDAFLDDYIVDRWDPLAQRGLSD